MDESKQYIEMCEKAEEIQQLDPDSDGGFYAINGQFAGHKFEWVRQENEIWTWLPRQDQLWEMVGIYPDNWVAFLNWTDLPYPIVVYPLQKQQPLPFWHFNSMEQFLFAFVMHKNYQKVWQKGNWIKE